MSNTELSLYLIALKTYYRLSKDLVTMEYFAGRPLVPGIHADVTNQNTVLNARTKGFPAGHCIITR